MPETANNLEAEAEGIKKSELLPKDILGETIIFYNRDQSIELAQELSWIGLVAAEWKHAANQQLFSIDNYLAGLRRSLNNKPTSSSLTDEVLQTLERIQKIVQKIREIEFIRLLALKLSQISRQTMIDEELHSFINSQCHHHEGIKIDFDLNCPTIAVNISPYWLQIALEKLISNALKAMPDGGRLTIRSQVVERQVKITIKDTGLGIPESVRPYFLKGVIPPSKGQSGSGMGVMIAFAITLKHQGDIKLVNSSPTEGTELCMRLPMA